MNNVQTRVVAAQPDIVGRVLDEIADPEASVWPTPAWPPLTLHNGLHGGSRGGHGPLGYQVTEHDAGRKVKERICVGVISGIDRERTKPGSSFSPSGPRPSARRDGGQDQRSPVRPDNKSVDGLGTSIGTR